MSYEFKPSRYIFHAITKLTYALTVTVIFACSEPASDAGQMPSPKVSLLGATATSEPEAVGALMNTIDLRSFCTGTLISPTWVLTAAHCVENKTESELLFTLDANVHTSDDQVLIGVKRLEIHPGYRPTTFVNDLALLELSESISDVDFPELNQSSPGASFLSETLDFVGYGYDEARYSGVKRTAPIPVLSLGISTFSTIWTTELETGACFGDSGGPAFLPDGDLPVLVGVVSNILATDGSDPCIGTYNVTRVDMYSQWILSIIDNGETPGSCSQEPAICFCDDACGDTGECDNSRCLQLSCEQTYDCVNACDPMDGACMNDCYIQARIPELEVFENFLNCGNDNCSSADEDELFDCLYSNCHDSFHSCFGATDCDLTGGDCDAGTTCRPVRYSLTACVPGLDRNIGESCNPDADVASCADGSICALQSGSQVCSQLCFSNDDCDDSTCIDQPISEFRGEPISVCEEDIPHVTGHRCDTFSVGDIPTRTLLRLIF